MCTNNQPIINKEALEKFILEGTMMTYVELFVISLILLLPFLYETSHIFRYYLKFAVYYAVVSINSIILIPPMLFRPCDVKNLL